MKNTVSRGLDLSDMHMDHCSAIMKEQFPEVDGLQRMSVFDSVGCQRIGTPEGKFVQILLVGCHWVTVSNIGCDDNCLLVYDSMYRKTPKMYRNKFLAQVAWLCHVPGPVLQLLWPDIQTQKGNHDCGLFAIANAFALCCGQRPDRRICLGPGGNAATSGSLSKCREIVNVPSCG